MSLAKYRHLVGVAIAALILTVIFVPFQSATAFTVTVDLPDDDDDTVTQSAAGEPFQIIIDVEAAELVSIESIEIILDNGLPSVKRTIFDDAGVRASGSSSLVIGNIVEISNSLDDTGYGYGFGYVTTPSTFSPPNTYSFATANEDFIGGNTAGSGTSGSTDFVRGLIGPGTITISGTLRTADLAGSTHTLDVLVDTGANGVGNEDVLVATQFSFDVVESTGQSTVEEEVTAGSTSATITLPGFELNGSPVTITLNFSAATTTTGNAIVTLQTPGDFVASKTAAQLTALGLQDIGGDLVIDDEFTVAGVISDIDLSALGLPPGTEITIGIPYEDSLSSDEEENMRLFHFDDGIDGWEALTNDDLAINGGDEVDTAENIVYGTTDDFSLFAPAFSPPTGGGGDDDDRFAPRGGGQKVYVGILPESFLVEHPLLRVQIRDHAFLNSAGERITSIGPGEQITIAASFKNNQGHSQTYALIVQIVNADGITTDIGWLSGNSELQEIVEGSRSWVASEPGEYTVRIFVWNSIDVAPIALTDVAEGTFSVKS